MFTIWPCAEKVGQDYLAWGNPALEPTGPLVGLMADSGRAHTKEYVPELLLPVSLSPWWAPAALRLCRSAPTLVAVWLTGSLCSGRESGLSLWGGRAKIDIGLPETSQPHVISNGKSSPTDLHLHAKTQLHSTTSRLQRWTPCAKQLARQEHSPTH